MPRRRAAGSGLMLALAWLGTAPLAAQPADLPIPAASTQSFPPGISLAGAGAGQVYVDGLGRVLYGMDMRVLQRFSPDPALYCGAACAQQWEPLLAPIGTAPNIAYPPGYRGETRARGAGAAALPPGFVNPQSAPDWTVIAGPQGPQWVYKGWHMVFTHRGDKPGAILHEGAENRTWNTLKYIAPAPRVTAPGGVQAVLAGSEYLLADRDGRALFTGSCAKDCPGWQPLTAGMASAAVGGWAVSTLGDIPQWTLNRAPVFVASAEDPTHIPAGGKALRP
jgi:predicted lipoprotein with Yx(FWY)xxD motif